MDRREFETQPGNRLGRAITRYNGHPPYFILRSNIGRLERQGLKEYLSFRPETLTEDVSIPQPIETTRRRYILKHNSEIPTKLPHKHNTDEELEAERRRHLKTAPTYPMRAPQITEDYPPTYYQERAGYPNEPDDYGFSNEVQKAVARTFEVWNSMKPKR